MKPHIWKENGMWWIERYDPYKVRACFHLSSALNIAYSILTTGDFI